MYRNVMYLCLGLLCLGHSQIAMSSFPNMTYSSNTRKPPITVATTSNNVATTSTNNVATQWNNSMTTQWNNNVLTATNNINNNVATASNNNVATQLNSNMASSLNNNLVTATNNHMGTESNNNVTTLSNNNVASQLNKNVPTVLNNNIAPTLNNNMATQWNNNMATTSSNNVASQPNNNVPSAINTNIAPTLSNKVISGKNVALLKGKQMSITSHTGISLSSQQTTITSSNHNNRQSTIISPALVTNASKQQQPIIISPYSNYPQILTTLNIPTSTVSVAEKPAIMSPSMWLAQMSTMSRPYAVRHNIDPLPDRITAASNRPNCFDSSNDTTIYRFLDGSCNNVYNPTIGQSFRAYKRYLNPRYSDMHCLPRIRGRCLKIPGQNKCYVPYLPSARTVSRVVHTESDAKSNHSLILSTWAQLVSNDLSATAVDQTASPNPCCTNPIKSCYSDRSNTDCSENCFPINIVQRPADRYFKTRCMEYIRSRSVNSEISIDRPREQLNMVTPFLDASTLYGSDQATLEKLRGPWGGKMKVSPGELLPVGRAEDCIVNYGGHCFASGDERVNQSPELAMLTLAMVNIHNSIADQLIETGWDADKIFQETKKIINAFIQRITYVEFLPEILNAETLQNNELVEGIYNYEDFTDPRIANVFSTAAFQFIHSLTPSSIEFDGLETPLVYSFNNQTFLFTDTEKAAVYMVSSAGEPMDRFFSKQLTDQYFQNGNISFDLVAQIIQRGRDHGLPSYNMFRRQCGLPQVPNLDAMPAGNILKGVYHNIDDVDIFVGGMVENPLPGSLLGPTFSCLIARQFRDTKFGDSHWYESTDPKKGFTEDQLKSIKAMSAAKVLCVGLGLSSIPQNPFRVSSPSNPMQVCSDLPDLDIQPWYLLGNKI